MTDDIQHLRETPLLRQLLGHYSDLARADRQAWQDRVMQLEQQEAGSLSRLHGELLAFGWLEQNTGNTPLARAGQVPGCYRVTPAGQRILKQLVEDSD